MNRHILIQYLEWHFLDVSKGILHAWQNCLRFNLNHWSVPLLLKTWFSPWRRYKYDYGKGFSFGKYFEVFTFNMSSRIIRAIMRTVLIILGLSTEVLVFFSGAIVFLTWLVLPFLLIIGFIYGFKILVQ